MSYLKVAGDFAVRLGQGLTLIAVLIVSALAALPLYLGVMVYQGLCDSTRDIWNTAENEGWVAAFREVAQLLPKCVRYILKGEKK